MFSGGLSGQSVAGFAGTDVNVGRLCSETMRTLRQKSLAVIIVLVVYMATTEGSNFSWRYLRNKNYVDCCYWCYHEVHEARREVLCFSVNQVKKNASDKDPNPIHPAYPAKQFTCKCTSTLKISTAAAAAAAAAADDDDDDGDDDYDDDNNDDDDDDDDDDDNDKDEQEEEGEQQQRLQ